MVYVTFDLLYKEKEQQKEQTMSSKMFGFCIKQCFKNSHMGCLTHQLEFVTWNSWKVLTFSRLACNH